MSSRKVRHNVKQKVKRVLSDMSIADELVLPRKSNDLTNPWDGPKDGKSWWDRAVYKDNGTHESRRREEWYKKLMRK